MVSDAFEPERGVFFHQNRSKKNSTGRKIYDVIIIVGRALMASVSVMNLDEYRRDMIRIFVFDERGIQGTDRAHAGSANYRCHSRDHLPKQW